MMCTWQNLPLYPGLHWHLLHLHCPLLLHSPDPSWLHWSVLNIATIITCYSHATHSHTHLGEQVQVSPVQPPEQLQEEVPTDVELVWLHTCTYLPYIYPQDIYNISMISTDRLAVTLVLMSAYHQILACPLVLQIDENICEYH